MKPVIPYFFPYVIYLLTLLGISSGGLWTFSGFIFIFGIHPFLDYLLREFKVSPVRPSHFWANIPLYLSLPFLFFLIFIGLQQSAYASTIELIGQIASIGALCGIMGITIAHELVHRSRPWERVLGYANLYLVNLPHWGIEHVYGHHRFVGTLQDGATARKNETLYAFWFRNYWSGLIDSWQIEKIKNGLVQNLVLHMFLIQILISTLIYFFFGQPGILFFWGKA